MIDRPTAAHCLVLAILLAPTFACDPCEGHDPYKSEHWCNSDSVVVCRGESSGNRVEVVDRCMAGGCYKDPSTGQLGCRVPDYTCPSGVTGYQCLGDRRIDCAANGVTWDYGDCSENTSANRTMYTEQDISRHCVQNPGGAILGCGYTNQPCANPGQVQCIAEGTVVCRDSVWQGFVPDRVVHCDPSSIRYDEPNCTDAAYSWCEEDQVRRCTRCVSYPNVQGTYEYLCVGLTTIAQCEPGACFSHYRNESQTFPDWISGCTQPAAECVTAGQSICIENRPGYCVAAGTVALDRDCRAIFADTPICETTTGSPDAGVPGARCN